MKSQIKEHDKDSGPSSRELKFLSCPGNRFVCLVIFNLFHMAVELFLE